MELLPILTRAESLFRRFDRSVQAIDKKNNFPAPAAHQRKQSTLPDSSNQNKGKSTQRPQSVAYSSGVSAGSSSTTPPGGSGSDQPKVISPELRDLLQKGIYWKQSPSVSSDQKTGTTGGGTS